MRPRNVTAAGLRLNPFCYGARRRASRAGVHQRIYSGVHRLVFRGFVAVTFCVLVVLVGGIAAGQALDIPESARATWYERSGRGGSCAWVAVETCFRCDGATAAADRWRQKYGGEAYPDDIASALDREGVYYLRSRGSSPDPRIFDLADAAGKPLYVGGNGERGRYGHAVVYAGRVTRADGTRVVQVVDCGWKEGQQRTWYEWGDWLKHWSGNAILPFPRCRRTEVEPGKLSNHPTIRQMHAEAVRRRGGRQFELDEECCQFAQRWANHMAKTGKMKHGGGEQIIAMGYGTVSACFNGWMGSRGHRNWILRDSTKAGWGVQKSARGTWYWAGVFR